jgi:hypothetical protein
MMKTNRSAPSNLLPESFRLHKRGVHPDSRGRVTLGSAARQSEYGVLVNERGQILLNPVVTMSVPASEAWLWENPAVRTAMRRALRQAAAEEFHDLGSFAEHATAEVEEP